MTHKSMKPSQKSLSDRIFEVIHQDKSIVLIEKRKSFISQRNDKAGHEGLVDFVSRHLGMELYPVHRLDREVGGLMLFAKDPQSAEGLIKQFRERTIGKIYHAWVYGIPQKSSACLVHYLKKNPRRNYTTVFDRPTPGAKQAILEYRVLATRPEPRESLVEVRLHTGRSHQIRVQLFKIGHSIVGDTRYQARSARSTALPIQLRSSVLEFDHPETGERLSFSLPLDPKNHFLH